MALLAAPATMPASLPASRPVSPQSAVLTAALELRVSRCDDIIRRRPDDVAALQARAEALFRLGRIADSVRDFDRVVELAPDEAPHNWQRGIALYYAGRYADGARQFEMHQKVNPQDVENAAWHFLCLSRDPAQKDGAVAAARRLIPIESDTRIPLMTVHAMYAGKASAEDVLAETNKGDPEPAELLERLFYAHLYIGLYHEARGEADLAALHLNKAATTYAVEGYMGDVARVHVWLAGAAKR